jgi:hypothetical protein
VPLILSACFEAPRPPSTARADKHIQDPMRLLYTASDGTLRWTEDIIRSEEIPPYAILSHTWGEQEVVFNDLKDIETAQSKEGYRKIRFCAQQAERDGLNHF